MITLPAFSFKDQPNLGLPQIRDQLEEYFDEVLARGSGIREVVLGRAQAMDQWVLAIAERAGLSDELALFAVGGYGRGELSPYSDVDLMVLSADELTSDQEKGVQEFVRLLWDARLEPGISVRTLSECFDAADDITVATSLIEARLIFGPNELKSYPRKVVFERFTPAEFYQAKTDERLARFSKHNFTEYNLEPDLKNAPGGLRDIHHIGWIAKRYFRVRQLPDLIHQGFMSNLEFEELIKAEDFLWLIRHHLQREVGRNETRLLFDFQRGVAKRMGYADNPSKPNAAIEALMRDYYRRAMDLSTLSEMLSALFYETLIESRLPKSEQPKVMAISEHFEQVGDKISVIDTKLFPHHPGQLLEIFVLMGTLGIKDIRAKTLRLIKLNAHLIDADFRSKPQYRAKFRAIIADPNYLHHRLRMMKRYGVLGRYLPAFEKVRGLMQYDLFHRYTVDAHTLFLFRMLHRLGNPDYRDEFATVGPIYDRLERKEIIHLAAIFHDIAKGRGGDHSELGATDALKFCKDHGYSEADGQLVAWLVESHLLMSLTSQKMDISDPEVVKAFSEKVGDMLHLNHLYVLTVADMNATNSDLWNSWRSSLMSQLYKNTRYLLLSGNSATQLSEERILETKLEARSKLGAWQGSELSALWDELGEDYFLRETVSDVVWHSEQILAHKSDEPLICIREHRELALDAVQLFVYVKNKPNLFAATVSVFERLDLDVQDARVITATRDFALDSYVLLDPHGTLLQDPERLHMLKGAILKALNDPTRPRPSSARLPRRLKHFDVETKVNIGISEDALPKNQLFIQTRDQPGLLARIGQVFIDHQIEVHAARIITLGERAEDVFTITNPLDELLTQPQIDDLKRALHDSVDQF